MSRPDSFLTTEMQKTGIAFIRVVNAIRNLCLPVTPHTAMRPTRMYKSNSKLGCDLGRYESGNA